MIYLITYFILASNIFVGESCLLTTNSIFSPTALVNCGKKPCAPYVDWAPWSIFVAPTTPSAAVDDPDSNSKALTPSASKPGNKD